MERRDFSIGTLGEKAILLAGVALRLTICPGDDIALVSGSLAAGSGHETENHEAVMPAPFELNFNTDSNGKRLPKNLR